MCRKRGSLRTFLLQPQAECELSGLPLPQVIYDLTQSVHVIFQFPSYTCLSHPELVIYLIDVLTAEDSSGF